MKRRKSPPACQEHASEPSKCDLYGRSPGYRENDAEETLCRRLRHACGSTTTGESVPINFQEFGQRSENIAKCNGGHDANEQKPGKIVIFAYIVYKSRAQRDRVNARVMKDPRLAKSMDPTTMPFDAKRMFWGGFKVLIAR